jgi:hypothetical protein
MAMSLHHGKTTECWKETQPRGRVDYFLGAFCMPELTDRQLPNEEQLALRQAEMRGCANTPTVLDNVALNKPATQSSSRSSETWSMAAAAVDGNTDGRWSRHSTTHTLTESGPWWEVDLEEEFEIASVVVYNRSDCCESRLDGFNLIYKTESGVESEPITPRFSVTDRFTTISFPAHTMARYVRIELPGSNKVLSLAEVEVNALVQVASFCPMILMPGVWCYSPNKEWGLVYQTDGNLVLYNTTGTGAPKWASGTSGSTVGHVQVGVKGLKVLNANSNEQWSAVPSDSTIPSGVQVLDDGNFVVWKAGVEPGSAEQVISNILYAPFDVTIDGATYTGIRNGDYP